MRCADGVAYPPSSSARRWFLARDKRKVEVSACGPGKQRLPPLLLVLSIVRP
jgi:hypothetical protein